MIYFATDHRGYELKEKLKAWLTEWGYEYEDLGAKNHNEQDDYPDFVHAAAQKVSEKPSENKAIILGASGQGEAMAANRHAGVRAAVYYGGPHDVVALSREHNDANVFSIGASFVTEDEIKHVLKVWLITPFSHDERNVRRINKIDLHNE